MRTKDGLKSDPKAANWLLTVQKERTFSKCVRGHFNLWTIFICGLLKKLNTLRHKVCLIIVVYNYEKIVF